jgi:hypothetical protein
MIKIEHDTSTGQITEIELSAGDITEIETLAGEAQLVTSTKTTKKAALLAKLGITDDEAKLLLS